MKGNSFFSLKKLEYVTTVKKHPDFNNSSDPVLITYGITIKYNTAFNPEVEVFYMLQLQQMYQFNTSQSIISNSYLV